MVIFTTLDFKETIENQARIQRVAPIRGQLSGQQQVDFNLKPNDLVKRLTTHQAATEEQFNPLQIRCSKRSTPLLCTVHSLPEVGPLSCQVELSDSRFLP